MFPGLVMYCVPPLVMYYADPAQPFTTAAEELDYLDRRLSGACIVETKNTVGHNLPHTKI